MKRILVFVMTAVIMVGVVVPKNVRAEELSFVEAFSLYVELFGDTFDIDSCTVDLDSLNEYKYYFLLRYTNYGYTTYYCFFFNEDVSLITNGSSTKYFVFKNASGQNLSYHFVSCTSSSTYFTNINTGSSFYRGTDRIYINYSNDLDFMNSSSCDLNLVTLTPHSHTWISKEESATCTASGKTWQECECGIVQNKIEIPAIGHTWVSKEDAATCTDDGKTWDECSVCNDIQNESVVPATGHGDLVYEVTKNPSVDEEGTYIEKCEICGVVINSGALPTVSPTPTPRPTSTPRPTATPRPTRAPRPTSPPDPVLIGNVSGLLGMITVVLSLFMEFPLNIYLIAGIITIIIGIYIALKQSIK